MKDQHILIIEDTAIDIFVAARIAELLHQQVRVKSFQQPEHALEYLYVCNDPEWPELILLDIRFPRKDGFYFMDEWMKFPEALRIKSKILLVSASLDPGELEAAMNHPASAGLINKPLTVESLGDYLYGIR